MGTRTEKNAARGYRALWKKIQKKRRSWSLSFGRFFYRHFPDVFNFHLGLPWFSLRVRLLSRVLQNDTFYVLGFQLWFVKWGVRFNLGESRFHAVDRGAL